MLVIVRVTLSDRVRFMSRVTVRTGFRLVFGSGSELLAEEHLRLFAQLKVRVRVGVKGKGKGQG